MIRIKHVFLAAVLAVLLVCLLPQTVSAYDSSQLLEDYVDMDAFQAYLLEETDRLMELSFETSIDVSQFQIPGTDSLAKQVELYIPVLSPRLSLCSLDAYIAGGVVSSVRVVYSYDFFSEDLDRAADCLLYGIEGNDALTDEEKALLIHDRLATWVEYDYANYLADTIPSTSYTVRGVLNTQKAVCGGYASTYQYLLNRAGIPCEYCSSGLMNHAWNIVYIDHTGYFVDVTWDDPVWDVTGRVMHDNFMRSTAGIESTGHIVSDLVANSSHVEILDDYTYDNYYWQRSSTGFQLINNSLYYLDSYSEQIMRADVDGHVAVSSAGRYSMLSSIGDKLLYALGTRVYLLDPVTGQESYIYESPDVPDRKAVYGMKYEKGLLYCDLEDSPYFNEHSKDNQDIVFFVLPGSSGWIRDPYGWMYLDKDGVLARNQWLKDSVGWCYVDDDGFMLTKALVNDSCGQCYVGKDGYIVKNRWVKSDGYWRYVDGNGYTVSKRWLKDGDNWRYLDGEGKSVQEQWQKDSNGWCYLDHQGLLAKNKWVVEDGKQYYLGSDGYMVTGWEYIGNCWMWFDAYGVKATERWVPDGNKWCYLNYSGSAIANTWYTVGDVQYYFDSSAHMAVGWHRIGNKWYWFDADGIMAVHRWIQDSSGWCYLGYDGGMVRNQWVSDNDTRYYLNASGHMAVGWQMIGSSWYWFDASGVAGCTRWVKDSRGWCYVDYVGKMVTSEWRYIGKDWYYLDSTGHMLTGWNWIDGERYWLKPSGQRGQMCWAQDSVGWCYLNGNGTMRVSDWVYAGADRYYLDDTGHMAVGWKRIDGNWYYFYSNGLMARDIEIDNGKIGYDGIWKGN